MDWWSEDVFGNECWSIGLERPGKIVNPTIKQESYKQVEITVENNCNNESYDDVDEDDSSHEDDGGDEDDSSHEVTSNGSVIDFSPDSSMATCDITFPSIKKEEAEEHLKKEYEEIEICEEYVSKLSEETNGPYGNRQVKK
ncbi:uncharacterized protein LOC134533273 isoform X5 [Bacillus rossius redtenbacheri]|uniref:uncharacterized protein LOC134533273 isoform X5 n=1 Tax=Bacillus rossius redtenbacheri TaxID=93214 RepID=UPI002FDC7B9F